MGRRQDKGLLEYVLELIPVGLTDSQIARRVCKERKVSRSTAYKYLDLAYEELKTRIDLDMRTRAISQAAVQIAMDRALALKHGDRREAGKAVDRFMRLHGIDGSLQSVVVNNTNTSESHVTTTSVAASVDTMTSGQLRALLDSLQAKMKGNA